MGFFSFGILTKTIVLIFCILEIGAQKKAWHEEKFSHQVKDLAAEEFKYLALYQPKSPTFESLLDPILIPRVSGTANNVKVKEFIINHMNKLGWATETDDFTSSTPHGTKPFSNIISTHNPHIARRLVLACHYDSKYFREDNFVGATDSAVPCAQMLHLASTLQEQLKLASQSQNQNVTLQFIFFDGEEAFVNWGPTDSLYGSRHLAEKWQKTPYPAGQSITSELNRMDVMVLLDLLGVANPKFYSFFQETNHLYSKLFEAEQSLRRSRYWTGNSFGDPLFKAQFSYGGIEDDHIPFLHRGVDIVHIIPSPFPREWHQPEDNRNALDFPTIENLNRILRVFVARYLHLPHNSS